MKHLEKYFAIAMLLFAVGFNLWLYRAEPTAKVDPNDNLFQFALVYRTDQIWDYGYKMCFGQRPISLWLTAPICFFSYLSDHWVPNWNEGYNLPFYYSHIPQIAIVGSYRFFNSIIQLFNYSFISLFTYYHVIIYLLLCLFPISMFLALRVARFPWITAGFSALLASQLSTDGLYGLDPPSFLWRGYGLSSQLFAMIFLPLAIAYSYRYFSEKKYLTPAVVFLVLTTSGHIGIGIMAFLSLIPIALAGPVMAFVRQTWDRNDWNALKTNILRVAIVSAIAIGILSYWIVPAFLGDKFHNFSFWDPVWKFNSYGAKETLTRLFNGDLFDYGRLPIYTGLVLVGIFAAFGGRRGISETATQASTRTKITGNTMLLGGHEEIHTPTGNSAFALLFIFWLLLYFGRTTWGNLINLIPALKEFHLSRFIVGVHAAGLFLAPIGLAWIASQILRIIRLPARHRYAQALAGGFVYLIISLLLLVPIYRQTIRYNDLNSTLISRANDNYAKQSPDINELIQTLTDLHKKNPGRVFAGRGGSWGKEFKIAETNMTMYLGNFAFSTVLWLPETWSPNGDTEQYFREDKPEDYALYNIRYVATPPALAKESIQPFWKLIKENPSWKLYEVPTSGYFTAGVRPAIVAADKYSRNNVVRLWIQSEDSKNGLYPQLTFDIRQYPINTGLPNFKMLDEVMFMTPDQKIHNVFAEPPRYISPSPAGGSPITLSSQTNDSDMVFSARANVPKDCTECIIVLKQTYHPNWRVTVDGKRVDPIITFPFFIGIPVSEGDHTIVASYEPSALKVGLLYLGIIAFIVYVSVPWLHGKFKKS